MGAEERVTAGGSFLTRDDTRLLKGIAIILMLGHHLWGFPYRIPGHLNSLVGLIDGNYLKVLGGCGKICIAMFAFLGGYGKFKKYSDKKMNLLVEVRDLYFKYWQVFVIFIPIGFLFFGNQTRYCVESAVCSHFSVFSPKELILNFLGLISSYNREWWFLATYLLCILLFPLIKLMVNKFPILINIIILLLFELVFLFIDQSGLFIENRIYYNVLGLKAPFVTCFGFGALFAKHEFFEKFKGRIEKVRFKPALVFVAIVVVFIIREFANNLSLDFAFVTVLIFALKLMFEKAGKLRPVISYLGKHSTNIWLIHTFFCYYFGVVAKSLVFFRWAIPALLVLLGYSLAASVILTAFWGFVGKGINKLFKPKSA